MRSGYVFLTVVMISNVCSVSNADDWPQWLGANRDGVWRETGIIDAIPESGLKVKWRVPINGGYSGPAVVGDRVIVTDYVKESGKSFNSPGKRAELKGTERVLCLSTKDGSLLWKHDYNCPYSISYPAGPRTTPTVDGDRVYTLGAEGHLLCLNLKDGSVVWSHQLKEKYKTESPIWGFSSHPLIDGDTLYCLVGGKGSVAVAFDKKTGDEKWKALSASESGYSPPTMITAANTKQLLIWDADKLNSLNPEDGSVYWSEPLKPSYGMSIIPPVKSGDYLFASGIGKVGKVFKLNQEKPGAEVVWTGKAKNAVYCANCPALIEDDTIFGVDCQTGGLRGVDLKTGDKLWETFQPTTGNRRMGHGTGFLVKQGNRHWIFSETGDLILAHLSREGYTEQGRFHVLEPTGEAFGRNVVWVHPAFSNGHCYVRNDKEIVCVSLRSE